jgi:sugar-specific transcriptional regulator TrmB
MINKEEVKKELYTSLKEIGLSSPEIELYVVSLVLGPSPIKNIAENMNISRPNVYKAIEGLERHGLAKFSKKKKYARDFQVEPPTEVLERLRKKRQLQENVEYELVTSMADLLSLYKQGDMPTKIKIHSTHDEFVKLLFQVLDEAKDEVKFFGSADAFIELISWETENRWIKKRMKNGIHVNIILTTQGEDSKKLAANDAKEMRTTKFFPTEKEIIPGFMLYANKVIVWQPKAALAILIEDEFIVEMLRVIFDNLWQNTN